jgi:hypothetical protein
MKETLEIRNPLAPHTITFQTNGDEIIKITEGKFYWKGEEVEDAHEVYERLNEWLKSQGR